MTTFVPGSRIAWLFLAGACILNALAARTLHADASGIVSDDFNDATLNGAIWTTVDPAGDAVFSMTGAALVISLPAATNHDLGVGGNQAARALQAANNTDFQIEAKFASPVSQRYQIQGILVQQDLTNYLRFEFFHDGSRTRAYAARLSNGSQSNKILINILSGAPMYMRILRAGNQWTMSHSQDGTNWTVAGTFSNSMTVSAVGPYAGNLNGPAHTAIIDYFFNSAEPIVPEDDGSVTLTVTINGAGSVAPAPDQTTYSPGDSVTLTAEPAAGFSFNGWGGALSGATNPQNLTLNDDSFVTANFQEILIQNIQAAAQANDAQITWTTAPATTGGVEFGETTLYELGNVESGALGTDHSATLTGLTPGVLYHYRITVEDAAGGSGSTPDRTFRAFMQSNIVSDDFNGPFNSGVWTFENPAGDGVMEMIGARLALSVPEGTSHDITENGTLPPRIMQSVADLDFEVEVKFESVLTRRYQTQGVLARQDEENLLRFEFFRDNGSTRVYAADITDGVAHTRINKVIPGGVPMYMWVSRVGISWMLSYSIDGGAWTVAGVFDHPFVMTAIGPYAGNVNGPAHTGVIDYFFNTAGPIDPEDGGHFTVTSNVTGQGSVAIDPPTQPYAEGTSAALSAIPAPAWKFSQWSGDLAGATNPETVLVTGDMIVTAEFLEYITGLQVNATETEATITWTTPEAASSNVAYGLTPSHELGSVGNGALVTEHQIVLTGLLDQGTTYHYQITSVNGAGEPVSTADLTFKTYLPSGIDSDDFHATALNTEVWTFVNPLGDATLELNGAQAVISVPEGTDHEVWTDGITAPRLMQASADADFEIEAKFESAISLKYQMQGIVVEESADHFLRFEFYSNQANTSLFVSAINEGASFNKLNTVIPGLPPLHMRVERAGNSWTVEYSADGTNWTQAVTFEHVMAVGAVGPYVGNLGPAHTGIIDYFFNSAEPIGNEDGGEFTVTVNAIGDGLVVKSPNKTTYAAGEIVELTASTSAPLWSFQNWAGDLAGSENPATITVDGDKLISAIFEQDQRTFFDIWYGETQQFGNLGNAQTWVDLLGNVSDTNGVAALTYSLNGGPSRSLSIGADGRRLLKPGDFNAQIAFEDLQAGVNEIVLTATDANSETAQQSVTINYTDGGIWPLDYAVDWSAVSDVQEAAQVVDGVWEVTPEGLRNVQVGYDRLAAVGDLLWTDYEITVPITVHSFDPEGFEGINTAPGAGLILRWQGHTNDPVVCEQPLCGWMPLGNAVWYRWSETGGAPNNFGGGTLEDPNGGSLELDRTYVYKVRVETIPGQAAGFYSFKIWPQDQPEPETWNKQAFGHEVANGSILFVAHWVELTIGDFAIVPLNDGGGAPANQLPVADAQSITINEDVTGTLTLTGSDADLDPLTYAVVDGPAHGTLSGVAPNMTYTPALNYHGADSFTFRANDGTDDSNSATVAITVRPINDIPQANPQSAQTNEDTALAITLTGTDVDGDVLIYQVRSNPGHGTLSGTAPNLMFTPALNYSGPDGFAFRVSDGKQFSTNVMVTISITPISDAPAASHKSVTTNEDTPVGIVISASDPDSNPLTYTIVGQPAHGVLSGSAPNLTYTPSANYYGADSFTFRANDGALDSNLATVSITVKSLNDVPVPNPQSIQTSKNTAVAITLTASDADGDVLTYQVRSNPGFGTLSGVAPNLIYTPKLNYVGPDNFAFRATDGKSFSASVLVSITVNP